MPPLWGLGLWVDARFYTDAIPLGFKRVFGVYTVCVSDPVRLGNRTYRAWGPLNGHLWCGFAAYHRCPFSVLGAANINMPPLQG